MKVQDFVFGSKSERRLYAALDTHWSDRFDLFPSLPFTAIIDIGGAPLYQKQKDFLYKTSVDYTLCTKKGKPIVSVEFDGMGHGFSREGEYIQIVPSTDPNRKLKLDLKLKLCNDIGYPFFVVSYNEALPIGESISLTIVDGLIGQVLAQQSVNSLLNKRLANHRDILHDLSEDEKQEFFQELVVDAEVDAELMWNPIFRDAARLVTAAHEKGLWKEMSTERLVDPPFPSREPSSPADSEAIQGRIRAFEHAVRLGCTVTVSTSEGEFAETAWVRNYSGYGISPWRMAESIAKLILSSRLLSGGYDVCKDSRR
jgi:hypothetical protein